ncbi:hypothetical protein Golob_003855, partial [Gossypium lobatum]|nr:hypothetical protein [Gossypium lobatum]
VLGLDNFKDYYNPLLKRVRSNLLSKHQVFIVEGDLNGVTLLTKLFDIASSSSVYGLNIETPFSACDRTDYSVSLYAATKKIGKEIAHTYNHIYDLSLTKLIFFIVYSPWRKPDMAYFLFTKDIM